MKKFKFFLIALLFAGGVTAAFAFTGTEKATAKAATDVSWFEYDPQFEGGTENPQNYDILPGEPECEGSGNLCAIQSNVMPGDEPDLTVIYNHTEKP
jgi:hypothetical protein